MVAHELYAVTCRAAAAVDPSLTIEGMISSEDGPNRTAILITVAGCHAQPCTIALTVDRSRNPSRQLVNKLVAALATHALDRSRRAAF
jgi:hypothetical protein